MVDLKSKLWAWGLSSEMPESYLEVIDILTNLRETSEEVAVQFEGAKEAHGSIITALNAKHQIMLLDNLDSCDPKFLRKGTPLRISTQKQGREILFESRVLEPFLDNLNLGYQVTIPNALGSKQVRGAVRLLLDDFRSKVRITLLDANLNPISGIVKNISRSGVGMKTTEILPSMMEKQSKTMDCKIELIESKEISCKIEIRNVHSRENGSAGTFIGGKILDINYRDNQALTNFIGQLQRQYSEAFV